MNALKRFKTHCRGSVATIFAIAVLPVLVGAGMALDYSRAAARRSQLQGVLDAALLSATRDAGYKTDAQLKEHIRIYIAGSEYGAPELSDITLERQTQQLGVTVHGRIKTTLMSIAGVDSVGVSATAKATWATADVVLVLDNSGSMGSYQRMDLLKLAAKDFIDTAGGTDGSVRIGIVPFAQGVRVDRVTYANASWIDFSNVDLDSNGLDEDGEDGSSINTSTWQGCLIDRTQTDYLDTNDGYHNGQKSRKYPAIQECRSSEAGLGLVAPLSVNFTTLKNTVNAMAAGGNTNMTIGVAWGTAMLSPGQEPFQEGRAKTTHHRHIIILLSDGANTQSRYSTSTSTINTRTKKACDAAKAAGIEIYTVALGPADTALLAYCATTAGNALVASAPQHLDGAFDTLAKSVRRPRLTH